MNRIMDQFSPRSAAQLSQTDEATRVYRGFQQPRPMEDAGGGDPHRTTGTGAGVARKKSAWVRAWLLVEPTGEVRVVEAAKHAIMRRTGLPARDLRILDPVLSHPSTILGRERAIVVNLEHIKAIITTQEVMFLNPKDPFISPFIEKLQGIFLQRHDIASTQQDVDISNVNWPNLYNVDEQQGNTNSGPQVRDNPNGLKRLPFELVALEACLESACSSLDKEARRLEQEAHPALDKLASKISTLNLESVRHIKSRLASITGRVQKVRDELENLLDDEEDMAEMYLTDKMEQNHLENSSTSSIDDENISENEDELTQLDPQNRRASSNTHSVSTKHVDVYELEMILEAYFVQIEGTLHKLSNLREYVDDTEDYINIMLDDKQNNLLQMGVLLTTGTMVVSAFVAVTGVFGMNISIELFHPDKAGMRQFLSTVAGGIVGSFVLYAAAVAWYKYKRLLQ